MPIPGKLCVADSAIYLIRLLGLVDVRWVATLREMGIVTHERDAEQDITTLCGRVTDQAALLGILNLAHGLGTQLLSVEYLPDGQN